MSGPRFRATYWRVFYESKRTPIPGLKTKGVRYHYDIGNEFFRLWLNPTMTHSRAYCRSRADSLERAQMQNIDHILRKISLQEGPSLLDIGSGWGHPIIRAARKYGVRPKGITLGEKQLHETSERIRDAGLSDKVAVELAGFRESVKADEKFDRVVSVGMFEHAGKEHLPEYFESVHHLLKPDGIPLRTRLPTPPRFPPIPGSKNPSSPGTVSLPYGKL